MATQTKSKPTKKLSDFKLDPKNANRHTERGGAMMGQSIEECGFGDSMTVTADDVIISGNQRTETLVEKGMVEPIIVESDGTRPIIHRRTDLQSTDPRARMLATYMNRVGELNLNWDPEVLQAMEAEGLRLGELFAPNEFQRLIDQDTSFLDQFIGGAGQITGDGDESVAGGSQSGGGGAGSVDTVMLQFAVTTKERTEIMRVLNHMASERNLPTAGAALYAFVLERKDDV